MTQYDADWLEGIKIFFNALAEKCSTDAEYAAELLKARGFLLEDTELALSDNSHREDVWFLNLLLQIYKLGEVKDGKIFIRPNAEVEKIFFIDNRIGGEAFDYPASWKIFVQTKFAPKVAVSDLEPFIARYVKAISACGVGTCGSCDGNHPPDYRFPIRSLQELYIDFISEPDRLWHEIICKRLSDGRFNLNWDSEYSKIEFDKATKWQTYIELNRAGKFLYDNRIKIRQIRREALSGITTGMARRLPAQELAEIFSERANELFDHFCKEL